MEEIYVGIDLGTTNTLACYLKNGKPTFIKFPLSKNLLPSVIYVDEDKNVIVGEMAKRRGIMNPRCSIKSSKTYMGDFNKHWNINGLDFTPTSVAAEILKTVKETIIKKLKCDKNAVIKAVITVPAYFNSNQTDETKKAGQKAGLEVVRIITEPMAAAIAAVKELNINKKIFVIDLGGGTFDLSVLEADQNTHTYNALDIGGDKRLGGDDFDTILKNYFLRFIESDLGMDLSSQEKSGLSYSEYYSSLGRVSEASEQAKIELSNYDETDVEIPDLFQYNGKSYTFSLKITREEFDKICSPIYEKIFQKTRDFCIRSNSFKKTDIEKVVLVGGSCYIRKIQEEVQNIFGMQGNTEMDLSTMVAMGACFVAASENGGLALNMRDILSHSLGIEVLSRENGELIFSTILRKGEAYPVSKTEDYTTTVDNQQAIDVNVYEAGSDFEDKEEIKYHDFYGGFSLDGIEIASQGVPHIGVTFSYDKSRCLTVMAKDMKTGAQKEIQIKKGEKIQNQKQQKPIDFIVLLDTSGSMYGSALMEAKLAYTSLVNEMVDLTTHRMSLIGFDSCPNVVCHLTKDKNVLLNNLDSLEAGGSTDMVSALRAANEEFYNTTNDKVVIMVTDGGPDYACPTLTKAEEMKKQGIRIVAIGVGSGVGVNFLKEFASPSDYYKLDNMKELKNTFKEVIMKITER